MTVGIRMATAAVLLIKAEIGATTSITVTNCFKSPRPAKRTIRWASKLIMPVRLMAPLKMNMASTVMVAGLLKPEIASSGAMPRIGPSSRITAIIANATKSMGKISRAKMMRATIKMPKATAISIVTEICLPPSRHCAV